MIDTINQGQIDSADRLDCINRAIRTIPYFYKMEFPIAAGANPLSQFEQRLGIGQDFYLTEMQGNFGEVFTETASLFNVSLYTGYLNSLYRWDAGSGLPSSFILTEGRFRTTLINEKFDDRQFESFPKLIPRNDRIYGRIRNLSAKSDATTAKIILKGFNILENFGLSVDESRLVNDSLSKPVQWEYFKISVTADEHDRGQRTYVLENDKYPRLILGFGAINTTSDKAAVSAIDVSITDVARRIQLTDSAIPLEFIAPRLTCLSDAHLYYLPVEYYFPPLGKLEFQINNTWISDEIAAGAEIAVLMRTI